MHHIHMATGFFFVLTFGFIGLVAIILAFVASMKKDRRDADVAIERAKAEQAYRLANPVRPTADQIQQVHGARLEARQAVNGTPMGISGQGPAYTSTVYNGYAPSVAAPVYHADPFTGLATGMLIGSALGHSHSHDTTTIIHDSSPSYVASSPSYSSSSSSDSGFSYSDSSSSSSYDGGSSSGFDASW
jgi:hypothetical protein